MITASKSTAEGIEVPMTLIEHDFWECRIPMNEVASMCAMIPRQAGSTSAGFDSSTVAIHIITWKIILVLEEISQSRYPEKINFRRGIVDHSRYVIGMCNVGIVDEFKSDCSFVLLPYLGGLNRVDFDIYSRESANDECPFMCDYACHGVINDERDSVCVKCDSGMTPHRRICCR